MILRWVLRMKCGWYLGFWNILYNIGGVIVGGVVFWGVNVFFYGNVIGMFIFLLVIVLFIGIVILFIGKDDLEELGWNCVEEIWEELVDKENIDF